ncbi:MAG: HYR domain-containing protein [Flavobacteriales bacterium]|nr:HYR domain-containing protein [Flavobacteriales bacterium]MCW8937195.1 HYR domain-containing protein [Flavobacteriales bacterium]MCW8939539.1 HYR domain-containing protein [Flavobacteriales bacterium]MCW8989873.1 HYR domain-containing protein [Flavobacteriales bacterium]
MLIVSTLLMGINVKAQCPTITCPSDMVVNNDSGLCSAVVNYAAPIGNDFCATVRDTLFYTGAIVNWTVPAGITNLNIEVRGAEGGYTTSSTVVPGLGAIMIGDFAVNPGDVFKVLVGENNNAGNGGGGGSFVTDLSNNPFIIAGGGGGASGGIDSPDKHGQVGTTGGTGAGGGGTGGTAGNGGNVGASFAAGAGGGLLTNGADGWTTGSGGQAFINGGAGANVGFGIGGFGGGGNGSGNQVGGGGGGYSGGGGGSNSAGAGVGGGGASFNSGTNQNNTSGANTGHGMVVFTYTNPSTLTVTQLSGLSSGSTFPVGVTTNTFEVSNGTQMDTCSFTVTVNDTEIPTISCPSNVVSCVPTVNNIAPVAADNCSGETVAYTLTGATIGSGASDASGTTFNQGITTVKYIVTDASGNKDSCSFNVEVLAPLTGSVTSTICNNDSVVVNGTTYNASNPSGTEVFTNVGPNGCDSTVTINLTVSPAIDNTTTVSGNTVTANETGATYQWLDCDNGNAVINGETSQSFTATVTGNYAVEITVGNCIDTSACENVTVVGIEELSKTAVTVYPNPTNGIVKVKLKKSFFNVEYTLTSIEGKVVQQDRFSGNQLTIDIANEPKGIYFIKIESLVVKLIKE